MNKLILSLSCFLVPLICSAQLNTSGVKYLANQKEIKVRMVVPDTAQAEKLFQEKLENLNLELKEKQTLYANAEELKTKLGKKLKEEKDIETLRLVNAYLRPEETFVAPKKLAKSAAPDLVQYSEYLQNQVYDLELAIKRGWQGMEYPQKEFSTTMENRFYRGYYFCQNDTLDKFDFEYQIKGWEKKLTFDEEGNLLKRDVFDKRGNLTYVACVLRTDVEILDEIKRLVYVKDYAKNKYKIKQKGSKTVAYLNKVLNKVKGNFREPGNEEGEKFIAQLEQDHADEFGCVYVIERVTNTSFRVVYYNKSTKKASYAALVTFRGVKNKKDFSVRLTTIPKGLPEIYS